MLKYLLFLAALGLVSAQLTPDCEVFENGCPVDFSINLLLPHETHCRYFYQCVNGDRVLRRCGVNTVFHEEEQACDHPHNVNRVCDMGDIPIVRPTTESPDSIEVIWLPNGCPNDYRIIWHLPHGYYCNHYYQCVHGDLVVRLCPPGLHYNATSQACDHPRNVNCTLPGGTYNPTTTTWSPVQPTTPPVIDFDDNGCPRNQSINWHLPHEDCTKFYQCVWGQLVEMNCSSNLHFNPTTQRCDNPATAGCKYFPCTGGGEDDLPCSNEDDPPPGGDDPPGCGGPGNPCSNEDDPPPGGVDPPPGCGGPSNPCSNEDDPPPGGVDPPPGCGGPSNPCSNEDDPPPGGVDPPPECGGPSNPCSNEDDPPPGGDDPPPGDGDECDANNKCVEECHVYPWAHDDCDKYWYCYGNQALVGQCSNGLFFNPTTNTCDFACNVDCDSLKVRVTPNHEGLRLYIPWNKFDDNTRELLKAIGQ